MEPFFHALLLQLSEPSYALTLLFTVALLAATLLPLGSEPVLLALITLQPDVVWPALGVATLGNTLGGMVGWWMGRGAQTWLARRVDMAQSPGYARALPWLRRLGPVACLGAWLPVVGDPICAVAGWLQLPFCPCVCYMAVGKFLRYVVMTASFFWMFPT